MTCSCRCDRASQQSTWLERGQSSTGTNQFLAVELQLLAKPTFRTVQDRIESPAVGIGCA